MYAFRLTPTQAGRPKHITTLQFFIVIWLNIPCDIMPLKNLWKAHTLTSGLLVG